jgi:hypothetical protein
LKRQNEHKGQLRIDLNVHLTTGSDQAPASLKANKWPPAERTKEARMMGMVAMKKIQVVRADHLFSSPKGRSRRRSSSKNAR